MGSGLAQKVFNKAFLAASHAIRKGRKPSFLWQKLVFSKIKSHLGGRVRYVFSGGAPLHPRTQDYLSVVLGTRLVQGYGLTETCGAVCSMHQEDLVGGNCGPPMAQVEVKLQDVPEMNYLSTDHPPTGELLVRGPCVSPGYHKQLRDPTG